MPSLADKIDALGRMSPAELRSTYRDTFKQAAPRLTAELLARAIAYRWQERQHGGLPASTRKEIARLSRLVSRCGADVINPFRLKPGTRLVRQWKGRTLDVLVCDEGFELDGRQYGSLTQIAHDITGVKWSGPRFFGLKGKKLPPARAAANG